MQRSVDDVAGRRRTAKRNFQDVLMGLQHVLVMYAGTIAVPLIVGSALRLGKQDMTYLINADLLAAGIVTCVQSLGFPRFGIRLPIMMGVTFSAVSPMIAIAARPGVGMTGMFGAIIASGLFAVAVAPLMGRLVRFFPPVVTGCIVTLVGLSLLRVGIDWSAGGHATMTQVINGQPVHVDNPNYGLGGNLLTAGGVLTLVLCINRFAKGILKNLSVLIGLVSGTLVSAALGRLDLHGLAEAPWVAVTTPFYFGLPTFDLAAIVSMSLVMLIVMVESLGMFLVVGNLVGQKLDARAITAGLRADGLGAVIGGVFNTFPYTSFSQNVGLLTVTNVRGRHVTAIGGLILIVLGLLPKVAVLAASIPVSVLGGAGLVMFGMVAATGIRMLAAIDYERHHHNLILIAVVLTIGMIPTLAPQLFQHLPAWTRTFTESGIVLGAITAIVLNLFFNGLMDSTEALRRAAETTHSVE